ncbi:MAG TPA: A/G-specific adenine glycosylase [Methylomirabilota bacterium]|nr:A/G-specific adenine glycosylase [Methylomirabilota bacterium]
MSTPTSVPLAARDAILAWYAERGRPLAFRRTRDPYAILVSEAMAQQTQATRAAAYWEEFTARFPTVHALAAATPADVLRAWQGLGYDRRALALWRAARIVVDEHGGQIPRTVAELEALPGVGPYTARAVAAIAFGLPVGAVDVNVRRVLGRIVAGDPAMLTPADLQTIADASVPSGRAGEWTHAVMDIGAAVCRPRAPRCEACPARPWCRFASVQRSTAAPSPRAVREPAAPFASTNRWLRGRILDRLRAVPDGEWVALDGAIGTHDRTRVRAAADAMAADGVLELQRGQNEDDGIHARLPLA